MILLVDGVDRSGKTSTINALTKKLGWPVIKHSKVPDSEVLELLSHRIIIEKILNRDVIFDRFYWPSDMAYNPVVEKKLSPVAEYSSIIQNRLAEAGAVIVYITAHFRTIRKRYEVLGEDSYLSLEDVQKVMNNYEETLDPAWCILPVLRIETDNETPEESADKIIKWIGR